MRIISKIRLISVIILIFLPNLSFCNTNTYIQKNNNSFSIKKFDTLLYFEDSVGNLEINDIIAKSNSEFKKYNRNEKLNKKSVYWAKFSLENKTEEYINTVLTIGKKRHSDIADIYIFKKGQQIKHARSGHFLKQSQKEIKAELGSRFFIKLEPKENYQIYIRIKNISNFRPAFELNLKTSETFYKDLSQRNLILGIIQGILWIMLFYNLLIYVYNRDKIYIFYSLYVFGMIFNIAAEKGLLIEYLIPEMPKLNPFIFIIATGLAIASYFHFLRLFLNTKQEMPKWDIALRAIIVANLVTTSILLVNLAVWFNVPMAINGSNILNMFVLLIGLFFMAYLLKHRSSLALFFIIGTIFLVVGTVSNLVFLIGNIHVNFDAYHLMNIGIIGQILFFSLGLGFKINQIEKNRVNVQKELISQLKKNEELKDKVNRELESRIKERTIEIQQKNDKLNKYTLDLEEKNNQLIDRNEEINRQKEEIQSIVEILRDTNNKVSLQNEEIEKVNKSITDSINSAKRIQRAMLPPNKLFEDNFIEHFIIYLPRDIVSGDFYWFKKINNYIVVIAADSTGHGVPGAFVSMMGMAFLNEIVGKAQITQASMVLDELRNQVKYALNPTGTEHVNDGMDISLCVINTQTLELQYSGANNPLYIVRKKQNENELIHIKPDKQPIGIWRKELPFTNHEIQLQKNDTIYLFSDGIIDQFGGIKNNKFKAVRFKELLLSIQNESLERQGVLIEEAFNRWKNGRPQIDDIVVLGIKP